MKKLFLFLLLAFALLVACKPPSFNPQHCKQWEEAQAPEYWKLPKGAAKAPVVYQGPHRLAPGWEPFHIHAGLVYVRRCISR